MLSAKCLQLCINYHGDVDRSKEAIKAALSFAKASSNTPGLHKIPRAINAFKTFASTIPEFDEESKEALNAIYSKYSIESALARAKSGEMIYAHEMLKHDVKNSDLVLNALKNDS
jgi:microcompartment protein CcmL/EutN